MKALIQSTFHDKPPFVPVKPDGFLVQGTTHQSIDIQIHDFLFIRKLFSHGKMTCYSLDAVTAAHDKRCALCAWNYTCTKAVRLMIMIQSIQPPIPAILDVADASLDNIGDILDQIPPEDMHKILVTASIEPNSKPLKINFTTRF